MNNVFEPVWRKQGVLLRLRNGEIWGTVWFRDRLNTVGLGLITKRVRFENFYSRHFEMWLGPFGADIRINFKKG